MPQFPDALFERVHAGTCVLCTGARLATIAGMPDWSALLTTMRNKLGEEADVVAPLLEQGKLLTVAGFLKRKLGNAACAELLQTAYGQTDTVPEAHKLLGELPFLAALTTGYDGLLERALSKNGSPLQVYTYADGAVLRLTEDLKGYVLKVHGDASQKDERSSRLVLSRLDYKRVIAPNQAFIAFMEDLYRTRTVLMVGFRLGDPDFELLLEQLMSGFRDGVTDHYALLAGVSGPEEEELYANYRVRTIHYEENGDATKALQAALTTLRDQWKSKGAELPGPDEPRQRAEWLRSSLAAVDVRLDLVPAQGLSLSDAKLRAIRTAAGAVELSQLDTDTLCRLGNVYMLAGEAIPAIASYEAALAKDDSMYQAHLNLHVAKAEAKQLEAAFEHLEWAIELSDEVHIFPKQFKLEALVGRGSTGSIYRAKDHDQNRDVTVKVLRTSYLQEYTFIEQWLSEALALKKLVHPGIAQVLDAVHEHGKCVLVTEWLAGESLSKLLTRGPVDAARATELIGKVCEALAYAHTQGTLHLDITPSNVFLREDGSVALMDFRPVRQSKGQRALVRRGDEGFQAPEMLAGAGADARADVYSLGALLYALLTGHAPVGSFQRAKEINPAARRFDALITRALRANASERPESVQAFADGVAGRSEAVEVPERDDDLEGWLSVLINQPDHDKARHNLKQLEQGYRAASDWDNLVTLILGTAEVESDGERRRSMFEELARIFEREVGDLGKAFAALKEAFRENSDSADLRRELERLAAATGMWNELLQEYTQIVHSVREPKVACDWWVRMGRLYSHQLGHDDYAVASFNQALTLDGNRSDALSELSEVLQRKGEHAEAARLMRRQIDRTDDAARKISLLRDLARLYLTELSDDARAMGAYREILAVEQGHGETVAALEGLYRKTEMWQELATLLEQQIAVTDEAEHLLRYRRSLARILATNLDQADRAIEQYQALLAHDADDVEALQELEKLYDKTGRNEAYLKILDQRIGAAGSDAEKAKLCRRMAAEWEEQPGGQKRAADYLQKVVGYTGGDEDTLRALVRLYWAVEDYVKLAQAYEQQINLTQAKDAKCGLYGALAKVYEEHLKDVDRALLIYGKLRALDERNKISLDGLCRLHMLKGSFGEAVEALEALSGCEENVDRQVEIFRRMGTLQAERLQRLDAAEISLNKALELKDDSAETMLALSTLYRSRKDFAKAARLLRDAARHTTNPLDKATRLFEAGGLYQTELSDPATAREVFEELIVVDPEHVGAAERLLALYGANADRAQAVKLYQMLLRKCDPHERSRQLELNQKIATLLQELGRSEEAILAWRAAYDLDPTSKDALLGLANLLHSTATTSEQHAEAGKLFQALLVHRRETLEESTLVDVFVKLGDAKLALGDDKKAVNMYEKALEVQPKNRQVLERTVALYEAKEEWDAVIRCKKQLFDAVDDVDDKIRIAEDTGDLLSERLSRHGEAITFYRKVVELKPDHRRALNKIMESFIKQSKWTEAIDAMSRIEDVETDPSHRARLHYTAGVINRDELKRPKDAAWHFDQALVKDPSHRRAFDALRRLYNEQRNYKGLVKAYRLLLQRLPEDTPKEEQEKLWQELGEICEEKLADARGAIVAFEVAAKLNPTDEARQERLARLYVTAGPDAYGKAIVANQRRLLSSPLRQDAYKELRRLYAESNETDRAFCVAAVLACLKTASAEEQAFYAKHRPEKPRKPARKLSDDLFRDYLRHADQHRILNVLFATVAPVIVPMAVRPAHAVGLRPSERLDLERDTRAYAAAISVASQVLGQSASEVYLKGDLESGCRLKPAIIGEGQQHEAVLMLDPRLLSSESPQELQYWIAKGLARLRPDYRITVVAPSTTVLRAVALAVRKILQPSLKIGGDVGEIERLTAVLKSDLPPHGLEEIAAQQGSLAEASSEEGITRWLEGVDLTLTRVALLCCDDLETAARLVVSEPVVEGGDRDLVVKRRLQELMLFAVSNEYFQLREQLGLKVG